LGFTLVGQTKGNHIMKKALLFSFLTFVAASVSRADWTLVTPFTLTNDLKAVTFGAGKYVAGGSGVLIYSDDEGLTWKLGAKTGTLNVRAIAFRNDKFVAVGFDSQIYHSADGVTWEVANFLNDGLESITFGNGVFVATGVTGTIAYSTNGTTGLRWAGCRQTPCTWLLGTGNS
jgi:photosystem II stability/assembly factor-like uncharacterized protein